jgi:DNA polymerase-3 subunit alpha (Gram-positive type)
MINIKQIFKEKDFELFSIEEKKILENVILENIDVSRREKNLNVFLLSECVITEQMLNKLKKIISCYLPHTNSISIHCDKLDGENKGQRLVTKAWKGLLKCLFAKIPASRIWMVNSRWELHKECLYIYLEPSGIEFLKERRVCSIIENYFVKLGYPMKVIFQEKIDNETYDMYEEEREIIESILKENEFQNNKSDIDTFSPNIIGKTISDSPVHIGNFIKETGDIIFAGEIFNIEKRELKNKTTMLTFGLTDYTGSIAVKIFLSGENKSLEQRFKEGLWLRVRGKIEKNRYTQEYEILPFDVNIHEKPERMDTSPEKRVELHLHTRYSSMDALCSPTEVLKMAKKWGHKAVAFTDHGVLQSFPEIYEASKKIGIKPIYGLEAYVFDDENPVIISPPDKSIKDVTFVVVDIETTGLCFDDDEIIEIGAVKIYNNEILDRFSSFVKPKRPVPTNIINLTGITNDMLKSAPSIEQILPSFMEFLGEGIFVAHNAEFDSGFIRRETIKLGISFDNKILDTLALSRIVFSKLKNHRLNTLAKELNIKMGSHHRAVDDANTDALILQELLIRINEAGIKNISQINDIYKMRKGVTNLNSYHATILVKNMTGLKNLYKLVSVAHLDFFYRHPRIPKSLLRAYKEGLLVGSGCQAGELFQSLLHFCSQEKIEKILDFYDFLEIQPLHNNGFLIDSEYVSGMDRLKELNHKIYNLGKNLKKPVVLTGDVHFVNPEDEILRKILLNAQGFHDADKESKLFLKTTEEMLDECKYLGAAIADEVVIKNPNIIADEVEDVKPFPDELYPPKIIGAEQEIIDMTYQQARELYGENLPSIVESRIERELDSIVNNDFAVIYLVAHKLVKKSIEDGYLVGSRGSVGSSLVATMCKITEVNPLPAHYLCLKCRTSLFEKDREGIVGPDLPDIDCPNCGSPMNKEGFNIPFEVFMGFEGDKVPDIDLNFSGEYQSSAHKYTEELFGKHHVFRAGTISTVAQKTAFGFVKSYLEEKRKDVPSIEVNRLSAGITGVKRTTGQHPGGLIVVPKDKEIYEFTPIQHPADDKRSGVVTTHFEYHSISDRLLKLDLLGHDDPTVIKMLEEETGINARNIPLDDRKTMEIFSSLKSLNLDPEALGTTVGTLGVPEFGTRFVRQMLEDTRPTSFSELVRISGLSHGTDVWLNNAKDIIKNNIATLKDVIATRDDIMIYLIKKGIKHKTAFSIMEDVRKGRGLKPEYEKLLTENNNVDQWFIESCKKIKYLFPKAHAVAYVVMAFRIAYFKVHYPEAFYAAYFTVKADDFDAELILQGPKKVKETMIEIERKDKEATAKEKNLFTILEVVNEMYMRNIQFVPIDLYKSDVKRFKITKDGILPPISSLQGLGATAAQNIIKERNRRRFNSIEDLQRRTKITKNVVQILRQNGILNDLRETDQLSLF